jgi:hypothetical protein
VQANCQRDRRSGWKALVLDFLPFLRNLPVNLHQLTHRQVQVKICACVRDCGESYRRLSDCFVAAL